MKEFKYVNGYNGYLYFESKDREQLKKKIYKTPENLKFLGQNYIMHNNEKIYFSNCFTKILNK